MNFGKWTYSQHHRSILDFSAGNLTAQSCVTCFDATWQTNATKTVQPACLHGCIFLKSDASLLYQFNCLHGQADTKFLGYPISLDCTCILARWSAYFSVHYDTILHPTFVLLYCCELCIVLRFYCICCCTCSVLGVGCVHHDRNIYISLHWRESATVLIPIKYCNHWFLYQLKYDYLSCIEMKEMNLGMQNKLLKHCPLNITACVLLPNKLNRWFTHYDTL